jgi:hypothetical protein
MSISEKCNMSWICGSEMACKKAASRWPAGEAVGCPGGNGRPTFCTRFEAYSLVRYGREWIEFSKRRSIFPQDIAEL